MAQRAWRLIAWTAVYGLSAAVVILPEATFGPVAWCLPTAVGVGMLAITGYRSWAIVFAIEAVARLLLGQDGIALALLLAGATTLEVLVGAWLVRRRPLRFRRPEDVAWLLVVAVVISAIGATLATGATLALDAEAATRSLWTDWLLGDVTALVTALPVVLLIAEGNDFRASARARHGREVEVAVVLASAIGIIALALALIVDDPSNRGSFRFFWILPIVWAATRFDRVVMSVTVMAMAVVAFPFVSFAPPGTFLALDIVSIQGTLITCGLIGMALAAVVDGRRETVAAMRQTLAELEASEVRYAALFADSPVIQWLLDPETTTLIDVSEAAARFYGYARDEMRGRCIADISTEPPDVITANMVVARNQQLDFLADHRLASGAVRRMEVHTGPLLLEGRLVLHFILRDATDELAARAEVARLAAVVESSAEAVVTTDLDGLVTGWNGAAEQLYGYSREDAVGRPVIDLLGPIHVAPGALASMAREGRSIRLGHMTRRAADGSRLPVDLTISPIIAEGVVIGMSRISHDLRESMREEQRLRRSEALLADAAEIGGMGSWEVDPETGEATWSSELYRITGVEPGTPVDERTLRGLAHPDDAEAVARAFESEATETPLSFRLLGQDGRERSVVATWRLVTGSRGEGGRSVGVLRDVTEERAMEEQLRQAQRLESIGMLAGGVAHDFNNLLTAIAGFADLARVSAEDGDSADADLGQVQAAVERGRALTSQLLAFGRRTVPRPRPVNVGVAVNALVPMLRRLLGEDITILVELEPDVVAIVDPGQLDQVVVNLAVNGRDAMPGGGRLRIGAGQSGSVEAGGAGPVTAWLEVEDDGQGIAPEVLDRIFVPFFTTKERGRGTGLGLATVQGIVTSAGGRVDVSSHVGTGTVFRVELPGVAGTHGRVDEVRRPTRATGDGLVLLVEDEDLVRQVATRILERAGFRVLGAANAPDALEIAGRQRPDILVSDIRLPGIGDGISLAEELHERWRDLPVLLMTGYTERVPPAWAALLAKPYEMDDLIGEVRSLLDQSRSPARATTAAGG